VKVLLDTHILIWSVSEPRRLPARLAGVLERSEKWASPITIWEILLLLESGRLRMDRPFDEWLAKAAADLALNEAPLTQDVVLASRDIEIPHRDPADRLLAATARYYELRLATADERLLAGKGFSTLAN
jgi:PIN domain nuclease of toxin-antitoxin system